MWQDAVVLVQLTQRGCEPKTTRILGDAHLHSLPPPLRMEVLA